MWRLLSSWGIPNDVISFHGTFPKWLLLVSSNFSSEFFYFQEALQLISYLFVELSIGTPRHCTGWSDVAPSTAVKSASQRTGSLKKKHSNLQYLYVYATITHISPVYARIFIHVNSEFQSPAYTRLCTFPTPAKIHILLYSSSTRVFTHEQTLIHWNTPIHKNTSVSLFRSPPYVSTRLRNCRTRHTRYKLTVETTYIFQLCSFL